MVLFLQYPKCTTCQRAKKWLDENGVEYIDRHIVEDNPTAQELALWVERSGMEVKSFFNTSGLVYKGLNLKEKLQHMTQQEKLDILATNGMLVKRPIIVGDTFVLTGFKEEKWQILKR